jgi:hypothetical protein
MTRVADLDQLLRQWMDDGPQEAPERFVTSALAQIDHTRQRRGPRLRWVASAAGRYPALAAASVLILVASMAVAVAYSFGWFTTPTPVDPEPAVETRAPAGAGFEVGVPRGWALTTDADARRLAAALPSHGVWRFAGNAPAGSLTVSYGDAAGNFVLCDGAECRDERVRITVPFSREASMESLDAVIELSLDERVIEEGPLAPAKAADLGGEPGLIRAGYRPAGTYVPGDMRAREVTYVYALHRGVPVVLQVDQPAGESEARLVDAIIERFRFLDDPARTE